MTARSLAYIRFSPWRLPEPVNSLYWVLFWRIPFGGSPKRQRLAQNDCSELSLHRVFTWRLPKPVYNLYRVLLWWLLLGSLLKDGGSPTMTAKSSAYIEGLRDFGVFFDGFQQMRDEKRWMRGLFLSPFAQNPSHIYLIFKLSISLPICTKHIYILYIVSHFKYCMD